MARKSRQSRKKRHRGRPGPGGDTPGFQLNSNATLLHTIGLGAIDPRSVSVPAGTGSLLGIATKSVSDCTTVNTRYEVEPETLNELLGLSPADLGKVDIARMNLLCASGMPTTNGLDIEHALSVLDKWAYKVAFETDRHLYRVRDPRYTQRYKGSEAHFRAEMLAQVLQEDLGVHYNLSLGRHFDFTDPAVCFIHGMVPGPGQTTAKTPGGTCATMPVLYAAVGRRLGYPLKLVTVPSHMFARWDGDGYEKVAWRETFNCETTNGFHRYGDADYHTYCRPLSDEQVARDGHLKSLSPAEELAQFFASRGHHGMDVGQSVFAARCYENACRYDPARPCYRAWLDEAVLMWRREPLYREDRRRAAGGGFGMPGPFDGLPLPGHVRRYVDRKFSSRPVPPSADAAHPAFPGIPAAQATPQMTTDRFPL